MVLRGTKIHPQNSDWIYVEKHIAHLQAMLSSLEDQEHDVVEEIFSQNCDDEFTISQLKSGTIPPHLSKSIIILIDRLQFLEKKHNETLKQLNEEKNELSIMIQQFVCGGIAGMTSRSIVAPIDRVKLIMQTAISRNNIQSGQRGIIGTAKHEISGGGIRTMWKGNFTNCLRVFPYAALQFATYERYKSHIVDYCQSNGYEFGFVGRFIAGACAGATAATLTYPLDVMRVRQVVCNDIKGPTDAIRNIYNEGGVRCFYKGWTPTLLSLAPFIATNFATFDALKTWYIGDGDPKNASTIAILGLGACAGLIAQSICYPLDTVRRSMQMQNHNYKGIMDCFYKIYSNPNGNGIKSFYKGVLPNAIKIVPNNGIRFLVYSKLTMYLDIPQKKKINPSSNNKTKD